VEVVRSMLDLLCTGRCNLKKNDVMSVVRLLTSLGLHSVVRALEQRGGAVPVGQEEFLRDRIASMDVGQEEFLRDRIASMDMSSGLGKHEAEAEKIMLSKAGVKKRRRTNAYACKKEVSSAVKKPVKKVFSGRYCVICGKKERNLYKLRVHYTNNHFFSEVSALITDKKSSKCELCGQQFSDCENLFLNVVRHRGATHKDVLKFVQKECENDEGVAYDHCQICDAKKDKWKSDSLGQHLVQQHYKLKLEEMLAPGQVRCTICDVKCKTIYDLIAHVGLTHGFALKMYRDFLASRSLDVTPVKAKRRRKPKEESSLLKSPIKMSKRCHLCHIDIAGSGIYWRYPLYAHFSRMHFRNELIRDFRTENKECSVCGISEEAVGKTPFLAHLGAKHRLVENYLEKSTIMGFELANDLVLEGTRMGDNINTPVDENDSKDLLKVTEAPSSELGDDSF